MNKSLIFALIALFLACLIGGPAVAQERKMYSWTDENGTVHFSETQPEGQEVREQTIPDSSAPASSNPYSTADSAPSYADERRAEIARKSEQQQQEKALKSVECASWQAEVNRLEPNRRVFITNAEGETERMDDVERTNRVAQLKSQIAKNCN